MVTIINRSSKALKQDRNRTLLKAIFRNMDDIKATPLTGDWSSVVSPNAKTSEHAIEWFRTLVSESNGNLNTIAEQVFGEDECDILTNVSNELWRRGDRKKPAKNGVHTGVKLCVRLLLSKLVPNPEVFPKDDDDSTARFIETVSQGLPKLSSPKPTNISSDDLDATIRKLLGL